MKARIQTIMLATVIALFALPAAAQADAPTVTAQPPALSTGNSAHFEFSYPAATSYTCELDGAAATACTSPYDLTGLADGQHSLKITAFYMTQTMICFPDPGGDPFCTPIPEPHWSDPVTVAFATDATAPVVTLTAGPAERSVKRSTKASFTFATEAGSSFSCTIDKQAPAPCASPLMLTKLKPGVHKVSITATDAAGNKSAPLLRTFALNSKTKTYTFVGDKVKRCTKLKAKKNSKKKSGKRSCKKIKF